MISLTNGDDDLWPDGSGNVESNVLGADAVDVAVYTIRGLLDLADMAASKGDTATQQWADSHAAAMEQQFSGAWWMPSIPQFADSLARPGQHPAHAALVDRRHPDGSRAVPGRRAAAGPGAAVGGAARPWRCARPRATRAQYGMYVEGGPGCDPGTYQGKTQQAYTLNTGVMAVGPGQLRPARSWPAAALHRRPGAAPARHASPSNRARCRRSAPRRTSPPTSTSPSTSGPRWTRHGERTACCGRWCTSSSGSTRSSATACSRCCRACLPASRSVSGTNIRVGAGSVDVAATHHGSSWTTTVTASLACTLHVGATLPTGAQIHAGDAERDPRPVTRSVTPTRAARCSYPHHAAAGAGRCTSSPPRSLMPPMSGIVSHV